MNTFIPEILRKSGDPANLGILKGYAFSPFTCLFFFTVKKGGGERGELHVQRTKYCARLPQDGTATQGFLSKERSSSEQTPLWRGIQQE